MSEQSQKPKLCSRSSIGLWAVAAVVIIVLVLYHFLSQEKPKQSSNDVAPEQIKQITLTAIVYSDSQPVAMIGSEMVKEGDMINGIKVIKIHKDKVELEKGDRRWTLEAEQPLE